MFPFLLPETQPFSLPKLKGEIFEDSFGSESNGSVPKEWVDMVVGHTINNDWLVTNNDATVSVIKSNFFAKDASVICNFKRLTATDRFITIALRWDGSLSSNIINNAYTLTLHSSIGLLLRKVVGGVITVIAQNSTLKDVESGLMMLVVEGNRLQCYYSPSYSAYPQKIFDITDASITTSGYMGLQTRAGTYDWVKAVRI